MFVTNSALTNKSRQLLCSMFAIASVLYFSAHAQAQEGIAAITAPSADVALSFIKPGRISKVRVKEGDLVKANQTLLQQDDAVEQAQLSLIREQSKDTTQIESRKASLEQKKVYLNKLTWAAQRGSATEMEVQEAKLEVRIAEYSLRTAEFEHEQNKRKYDEAKIHVDNMVLKSPISGRIEKVEVEAGESIDGLASAVRVVRTNPLWIDVHVPFEEGRSLNLNQSAEVIFPGMEQEPVEGKIIFVSTVADAASSTLRARIEVENKENRPVGEHVTVLFGNSENISNVE